MIKSKEILDAAKPLRISNHEDLMIAIGYGKVSAHHIVNKLLPEPKKDETEKAQKRARKVAEEKGIRIKGVDNIMYSRSKCCYPLPGEEVAGFVTRGRGVSIHTKDCHNLESLAIDKDRLIDVEWVVNETSDYNYSVKVSVLTIDKPGILADLSAIISASSINMSQIDAHSTRSKQAVFNIMLAVKNRHQLNEVMKKLSLIRGVIEVKRI
jgi:GTP pyrophosphokinase